ncbi:MAG: hypothetical protein KDA96_26430, partial [Planctomycetaceae bacterium]|nr:hypothetical protein [Planctomycetaceae bacterium]
RGHAGQDFPVFGELLPSLKLRVSISGVIQQVVSSTFAQYFASSANFLRFAVTPTTSVGEA